MRKLQFTLAFFTLLTLVSPGCKKDSGTTPVVVTPPVTTGKSYYVSVGTGADANTGLTTATAFQNIAAGINAAAAGDTVFVMNGTYTSVLNITKSGAPNAYITIKALAGNTPKIYISGEQWNAISINGSYIVLEGIEVQGDNANLTYTAAYAAYTSSLAGGSPQGKYNTNAISIGGPNTTSKFPTHVTIRSCKVHDFPGGGLSSIQADYTTFEGNTVYNNAWYMMYAGSGISILNPFNSDAGDVTKYKNIVRRNIVYSNKTTIPWISLVPARLSDGNGIIIDVNEWGYGQTAANATPYNSRTLVENNISFNNGGSGIHAFEADHVDIINNTAYGNGTMVGYADIYAASNTDVKIANNIMYSRTGGNCNSAPKAGSMVAYDYNVYYNGNIAIKGAHDKVADPMFVNLSTDGSVANFSLKTGSPAIDAGTQMIFSATDILNIGRPQGGAVDCGAYEIKQ